MHFTILGQLDKKSPNHWIVEYTMSNHQTVGDTLLKRQTLVKNKRWQQYFKYFDRFYCVLKTYLSDKRHLFERGTCHFLDPWLWC